ncbi:hypothetical protein Poli38472_005725 [Pythium oligandrum]|uniref:AGC protein kinase n=1 Tax=Pythium oligandrum TaxID=41045 RepID=A0A8K1CR34_PYTOL|nr:hypothetical protein Poli38472_005725 [Pythium oligandrum]|eukprot:TMW68257.1 hypothetical protein Poli38472_005725 [Pythium oligandrum]
MIEDKKRKPSRDFPAHANVPDGKVPHKVRVDLHQTSATSVPRMHDPYNILHAAPRTMSIMSTDSRVSLLSMDEGFDLQPSDDHGDAGSEDEDDERTSLNLPKNERPPQPANEREYFERLWAENFQRSEAKTVSTSAYIPVGAAARLNRIKGFSFARDTTSHRLYAVFRLEIECIVSEKQWTIYRRFHDFKQLAHQLKTQGMRISPVPTRTLMRSLDNAFLQKRQVELDRWLREVLMLVGLENCKAETELHSECCGNKGLHASCRNIRLFLTHSANQPPVFEQAEAPSSQGRSSVSSLSEPKLVRSSSSSGQTQRPASATSVPTTAQIDMLSSSLRESDMMGTNGGQGDVFEENRRSEQRRSVVVQYVDEEYDQAMIRRSGRLSLKDFDVLRMIGRGSFGKVLLVRKKNSSQLFAVKILSKSAIVKKQQVEHTRTERRVLASITHPFVVCLHYAFQTKEKLFFVLDYCPGGDLYFHLSRVGCFPEAMAKFYTAEIVLALIHLHEQGIVYRDLKPENIMLDVDGHVKLADFGLAKEGITSEVDGTYTMCGTPEYLPPEILNRNGHGTAADWWNLGMVLYEMLTGRPPWYTQDREELFTRLREAKLEFPEGLSAEAMDLIQGLLTRDPALRLGAIDPREITYHAFFADIDWNMLYHREVQPLYKPCQYTDPIDAANFEEEFTKLPLAQIESDGLSIATDAAGGHSSRGGNENGAAAGAGNAASAGSAGRNSTLRNLSYTFAGFTYEGSFATNGIDRLSGASYDSTMGSHLSNGLR